MAKVALVLGVGPGIGGAVAAKWASEGWKVACVARSAEKVAAMATKLTADYGDVGHRGYDCDVTDADALTACIAPVEAELGSIEFMCYNCGMGYFKKYDAITPAEFEQTWRVSTLGLLVAAQAVCPKMAERGSGVVAVTGATSALRGKPLLFHGSAKSAQRSLCQSLAKDLFPKGVHVFYTIVDGMVDQTPSRTFQPDLPQLNFLSPEAIAQTYWDIAKQPRSCFTFEIDMRPHVEEW